MNNEWKNEKVKDKRSVRRGEELTPRAWCLPSTIIYNSKGPTERQEAGEEWAREQNGEKTGKRDNSFYHYALVKGRAGFTNTHPPTLNRLLTVSSLSGFVDGILGASQAYGGLQRLIQ